MIDLLLQDVYVNQAQQIVKNFDDAIKKLTFKNSNDDVQLNCNLKNKNLSFFAAA